MIANMEGRGVKLTLNGNGGIVIEAEPGGAGQLILCRIYPYGTTQQVALKQVRDGNTLVDGEGPAMQARHVLGQQAANGVGDGTLAYGFTYDEYFYYQPITPPVSFPANITGPGTADYYEFGEAAGVTDSGPVTMPAYGPGGDVPTGTWVIATRNVSVVGEGGDLP